MSIGTTINLLIVISIFIGISLDFAISKHIRGKNYTAILEKKWNSVDEWSQRKFKIWWIARASIWIFVILFSLYFGNPGSTIFPAVICWLLSGKTIASFFKNYN